MHLKCNIGRWSLPEGRRTKDLDCLCGTVTSQATSSLTRNTKCTMQIHCCQPLRPVSSATESQAPLLSSFPFPRPCTQHGAPTQLLCIIPPPRGRTGKRRWSPSAKVKAGKEGNISSTKSAQPTNCFCNPSAPGPHTVLPGGWMILYGQHPGRGMRKRVKDETAHDRNLPAPFPALPFSVLVGNMDTEIHLTPTQVQKTRLGTPDSSEGWEPDLNQFLCCSSAPYSQKTLKFWDLRSEMAPVPRCLFWVRSNWILPICQQPGGSQGTHASYLIKLGAALYTAASALFHSENKPYSSLPDKYTWSYKEQHFWLFSSSQTHDGKNNRCLSGTPCLFTVLKIIA